MTTNQIISHQEQMQAKRRDFQAHWQKHGVAIIADNPHVDPRKLRHDEWQVYRNRVHQQGD